MRRGAARSGSAPSTRGRDHCRRPDQAADDKRAEALGPAIGAVHGRDSTRRVKRSWRCSSAPSATSCSTSSSARAARAGPTRRARAETRVGAGGQAANVAAWAAELGAEARFVGKRGSDAAGELAAERAPGRAASSCSAPSRRAGTASSSRSSSPDGSRTMFTDRGVAPGLRAEELEVRWFGGCDRLHLSGYSLLAAPDRRGRGEGGRRGAGSGRTGQHRPRVGVGDRRVRAGEAPRPARAPRARARVRERGRAGRDRRRGAGDARAQAGADGFRVDGADYPRAAGRRRGHDRSGRRARGRLPRRRARSSPPEAAARCVAQLGAMP